MSGLLHVVRCGAWVTLRHVGGNPLARTGAEGPALLGHIPDLEPPHKVKAVDFDCLQTDLELLGNELIGSTVKDKMQYLPLTRRQ